MHASKVWLPVAVLAVTLSHAGATQTPANGGPVSLGVMISQPGLCSPTTDAAPGALVDFVRPGGSADRAGLRVGDVLLHFGSTDIQLWTDLPKAMQLAHVGDRVDVTVKRGDTLVTQQVQFTQADVRVPAAGSSSAPAPTPGPPLSPPANSCINAYRVLPLPADAAQRAAALQGDSAVTLEGDVLTIAHRDARESVRLIGSLQLPMTRVPGTQVWLTQLQMDGWQRTFFSYEFFGSQNTPAPPESGTFHGAEAPLLPLTTPQLQGRLIHTHLHSRLLKADREISVYLPPGAAKNLPVLYMTDGQSVESFARVLEPLMQHHQSHPFAVIGEHAAQNTSASAAFDPQQDMRSREYLPGIDQTTFDRHVQFFVNELLPWASRTYGVSAQRAGRALFGFSSGAAFGLDMAVNHPELFAAVLPFSAGKPMLKPAPKPGLPHVYLAAGVLEPPFAAVTRQSQDLLREAGAETEFTLYPSGHDILMWQLALVKYVPRVFPPGTNAL
jgi:enterochelin esterase-like enzyme